MSATEATSLEALEVGQSISLPPPREEGPVPLERAIALRRSCRDLLERPLPLEALGQVLWAAQGLTDPAGLRAAPSAGARYPLRVRVCDASGVFLYFPQGHHLRKICGQDLRPQLAQACYGQGYVAACGATLVFTALYERTTSRYGERGRRYVHMDVGHAAQNVHLQAVALGLASVPVGAFDDDLVSGICELPPEESAVYLIPVGFPR